MRAGDSVARVGGDEIVVLLEGLDANPLGSAAQARVVAEKILDLLAQPYQVSGFEFHCSASIGIDSFVDVTSAADLIQHADLAMYQSKVAGRNRLRFFDVGMQTQVIVRAALDNDLHSALKQDQFKLFFQPQVNLQGQIVAAEALLRWQHPERGLVLPGDFIALAEENGLIVPIGHWVLQAACAQLKAWERLPLARDLRLAINVSARQYRQDNFAQSVQQALKASAIDPAKLVLEVTESMMLDVPDAIGKMQALKKLGVRFSLDDFGTGYSSLTYLPRLRVALLKIDQSFVRDMLEDPDDLAILQGIIGLAAAFKRDVIAEGVETVEHGSLLLQLGCELAQGYGIARPMPPAQMPQWMAQWQPDAAWDSVWSNIKAGKSLNGIEGTNRVE